MMKSEINYHIISPNLQGKPTIVFLHEGLGCIKTWKDYPQLLCNNLNMKGIVYERAGYGESPGNLKNRTNDYLIEATEELHSLLKTKAINQVILYGHSDGGSIALAFAAKYPQKVICLVSEAAHVLNETVTIKGIRQAVTAYNEGKLNGLRKWHGNNYVEVFEAWARTWLSSGFDLLSLKNLLPSIESNQLIIQGVNDQYGTIEQVETIKKLTTGHTTVLMPICGHAPFIEAQIEVLKAVINFIKRETDGNA